MPVENKKELLERILECMESTQNDAVVSLITDLHPADAAHIFYELDKEVVTDIFKLLDSELAAEILVELESDYRQKFLDGIEESEIAVWLEELDSDDATDILNELDDDKKNNVLLLIEDFQQSRDVNELLHYEEDTAGGLMAKELIQANESWTVEQCISEIRKQAENVENIYWIYITDHHSKLTGLLAIDKLIISEPQTKINDICDKEPISVDAFAKQEEVSEIMEKYDLIALPVINSKGKLLGRITIDDVVDVILEDAEKDIQIMSGISEDVEASSSVWLLSRARLPWLLVGMLGGIISAKFLTIFEDTIQINPEMALFIPMIMAMGGHAGIQSSTLIVQELSNKTLRFSNIMNRFGKMSLVSLLNGSICSLALFIVEYLSSDSYHMTLIASVALISVIISASIIGMLVPLILLKSKINPAVASGPFISMLNDLWGLAVYFLIARLMYNI